MRNSLQLTMYISFLRHFCKQLLFLSVVNILALGVLINLQPSTTVQNTVRTRTQL